MRFFFIKLLNRLLSPYIFRSQAFDEKLINDWLASLDLDVSGYKQYYTWRKRSINDTIALGLEMKEYWINIGRIMELKTLNALIKEEVRKRERARALEKRKEDKKVQEEKSQEVI